MRPSPRAAGTGPARARRIVFLGLFGQQNLGNDCSLQAMIENARKWRPDAGTECVCTGPEEIGARYGIPTFPMYAASAEAKRAGKLSPLKKVTGLAARAWGELSHAVKAYRFLKGSDMLIAPGTGLLVDHTTGFRGYPYYVFKWSLVARLCGCRFLIVSIGAGPLNHPLSRWFVRFALRSAAYRSYRDDFSKNYVESIGFEAGRDPVYPDLAFSLALAKMAGPKAARGPRPVVGVGVVDHSGSVGGGREHSPDAYRDYIDKSAAFIAWLLDRGYPVRMLIGDIKYDSRVRRDLMELLEKRGLVGGPDRIACEEISSLEDLLAELDKIDIVISPRFHNIILALMLDKPVIVLSHHYKFDALMAALGLSDYCLDIDALEVGRLTERFSEAEKAGEALKSYIQDKCQEYRRALDEQYGVLFGRPPLNAPDRELGLRST